MGLRKSLLVASTALVLPWAADASPFVPSEPVAAEPQRESPLLHRANDMKDFWDDLLSGGEEGGEEGGERGERGGEWGEEGGERSHQWRTPQDSSEHGQGYDWWGRPVENGIWTGESGQGGEWGEKGEKGEKGEEGGEWDEKGEKGEEGGEESGEEGGERG